MIGMLKKDLLYIKNQGVFFLVLMVFYFGLSLYMKDSILASAGLMLLALVFPRTAFSYDARANWEMFALTTPASRKDIVGAKYLLGLIAILISFGLSLVVVGVTHQPLAEAGLPAVAFGLFGIIALAAMFPILFKFGVEKAQYVIMFLTLSPMFLAPLIAQITAGFSSQFLSLLALYGVYLAIAMTVALMVGSYFCSVAIYKKKEF